jgi:hypothetical protein
MKLSERDNGRTGRTWMLLDMKKELAESESSFFNGCLLCRDFAERRCGCFALTGGLAEV